MRKYKVTTPPVHPNEKQWLYNGLDCLITWEVFDILHKQLKDEPECVQDTYQYALNKQGPVMEMELRGIRRDPIKLNKIVKELEVDLVKLQGNLDRICLALFKTKVNTNSPAQCKRLFYEWLKLPVQYRRTPVGKYAPTVDMKALTKLKQYMRAIPFVNYILAIRDLRKQISFLNTGIDPDGRFRCSYNIAGTTTGRLSSSFSDFGTGGNMQNIDRRLRIPFVPDPGMIFLNVDLEQADSRNVGARLWTLFHETHGPEFAGAYLDACESGDLHTTVAKMSWPDRDWTDDPKHNKEVAAELYYRQDSYRQTAKKFGHASNYRAKDKTVAIATNSPVDLVANFHKAYFKAFPAFPLWWDWVVQQLWDKGGVTTLYGRRRIFFDRANNDATQREAIAFEPQSMTAHEIDQGMVKAWHKYDYRTLQLLNQTHDSLLFQMPEECQVHIPAILKAMKIKLMLVGNREFTVPLEAKVGYNWGDYSEENPNGLKAIS